MIPCCRQHQENISNSLRITHIVTLAIQMSSKIMSVAVAKQEVTQISALGRPSCAAAHHHHIAITIINITVLIAIIITIVWNRVNIIDAITIVIKCCRSKSRSDPFLE